LGDLFERKQLERASRIENDVKIYAPYPVHKCMHTHIQAFVLMVMNLQTLLLKT